MSILHVQNEESITLPFFGAYGSTRLQKTILASDVYNYTIMQSSLQNEIAKSGTNGDQWNTILFKSPRYLSSDPINGPFVTIEEDAYDDYARCGLYCRDGYYDNETEYLGSYGRRAPKCGATNGLEASLQARHCELDRYEYDGDFLSLQVRETTEIDCDRVLNPRGLVPGPDSKLKIMDFYLGGDCGRLHIGDLSKCSELSHIYFHIGVNYGTTGTNTPASCKLSQPVNFENAVFPQSVRLIWSNTESVIDDAIPKIDNFENIAFGVDHKLKDVDKGTDGGELCLTPTSKNITNSNTQLLQAMNFSTFSGATFPNKSPTSTPTNGTYIVAGESVKTKYTVTCQTATSLILPDTVTELEELAVVDLETSNKLEIWVGEKLAEEVGSFAGLTPNGNAQFARRCPTLSESDDHVYKTTAIPYGLSGDVVDGMTDQYGRVSVSDKRGKKKSFSSGGYKSACKEP